jgi:hypothetical protein
MIDWASQVKQGDYVIVISNSNFVDESIREVTRITEKSIYVSRMQFLKDTKFQMNMKRRIEPFMAQHKNLLNKK